MLLPCPPLHASSPLSLWKFRRRSAQSLLEMSDQGKGEGGGNDWEVVSMTASVYAASPGSKPAIPSDDSIPAAGFAAKGYELSGNLFMSGYFPLPSDKHDGGDGSGLLSSKIVDESKSSYEDSCRSKMADDFPGIEFLEKEKHYSIGESKFGEKFGEKTLYLMKLGLSGEEMIGGSDSTATMDGSDHDNVGTGNAESPVAPPPVDDSSKTGPAHPCTAWWKRQAAFLYKNAKEAPTLWSILMAATLFGLVILGNRWHKEKPSPQQASLQLCVKNERVSCNPRPLGELKGILVAGNQNSPLVHGFAALV